MPDNLNSHPDQPQRFNIVCAENAPVFSIAPQSTRMVSAYKDRKGRCHVITDVIDHDRETPFNTVASWDASLEYYLSEDLKTFTHKGIVAKRGTWTGNPKTSDSDCVGVASPSVIVTSDRVWVYYASRGPRNPMGPFHIRGAKPNAPDALPGRIEACSAPVDNDGAPIGPFEKAGVVVDLGAGPRSIRLDDPCAMIYQNRIWMFFKAIGNADSVGDNRVVMLAHAPADRPEGPFTVVPDPVLKVKGGGEMPRVFHDGYHWHMFFRRFNPTSEIWEHYAANDPTQWELISDTLFGCAGPNPGKSVTDICPIWRPFSDAPPRQCFAAGLDDGTFGDAGRIKQWLCEIRSEK